MSVDSVFLIQDICAKNSWKRHIYILAYNEISKNENFFVNLHVFEGGRRIGAKHIFIGGTTLKSTHLNNSIPDFTSSGVREQGLALEDKYLGPSILIILIYVSKMSKS